MTNDQLNHYEALSNLVDLAQDHVTDAVAVLVGMHLEKGESVAQYTARVQEACDYISAQRRHLFQAKADKRAFVM